MTSANAPTGADRFDGSGHNRLLASLPAPARARFVERLEPVTLGFRQQLYEPGMPIPSVYFPLDSVASLLTVLADGTRIEVATVGNEGFVGVPLLLGAGSMPGEAICQVSGQALRREAAAFRDDLDQDGALRAGLDRYAQGLINEMAQSAACNRAHPVEQRLARWLLMTHDRVGRDRFPLTHQFMGQMLGVRRPTVTVAALLLARAGLIAYVRGQLTVTNRAGLESAACECYGIIRDEFDRLLGPAPPPTRPPG